MISDADRAMQRAAQSRAAMLSVFSNGALVLLKLLVGLLIGSVSVLSEAIHSGVDLLASLIAWLAVRAAGKPADKEHPFGHGKWENISGTIEALLIFAAAGWIMWEAIHKLIKPEPMEEVGWGIVVMGMSAGANLLVSGHLFRVGKRTDSLALQADAWHLRTDVYTSAGVMLGLLVFWVGRLVAPGVNLQWIDPLAALAVALLILKAAWELTRDAGRDLLDAELPEAEISWIPDRILAEGDLVYGFHLLRTRKSGPDRFIEFHLVVPGEMTVTESHALGERIATDIRKRLPRATVTFHIDPCEGACGPRCLEGCRRSPEERAERSAPSSPLVPSTDAASPIL